MKTEPNHRTFETRLHRIVISHGFLVSFAVVTVLAFTAGFLPRPGRGILAYPLLTWSPFLLLIGLHLGVRTFRHTRGIGFQRLAELQLPAAIVAVACYLAYFALHFLLSP
jgi:hypothetical protein